MAGDYARRRADRVARHERCSRQHAALGNAKLLTIACAGLTAWFAFGAGVFSGWWLTAPVVLYLGLAVRHERVLNRRRLAARSIAFYDGGLRRLNGTWAGKGNSGARFLDAEHPYAADLDIFGRGSLFELLCTARTSVGEKCLADWLCAPASLDDVRRRQAAIAELRSRIDLREELALIGEELRAGFKLEPLVKWAGLPSRLPSPAILRTTIAFAAAGGCAAIAWSCGLGPIPFLAISALGQAFDFSMQSPLKKTLRDMERPAHALFLLSEMLARLEREPFESPLLQDLKAGLASEGVPASKQIERLQSLFGCLEIGRAGMLAVIVGLVYWLTLTAYAIERWRSRNRAQFEQWVGIVGEFEALSSLAGYAWEHPSDPFPDLTAEGVEFSAAGLAHPLLHSDVVVRNDMSLGADARLYIVSGSNMSGKSTLLRTIGVNVVLALAGAPVSANRMRLSMLHVGASIRTMDSLQAGVSRFYAEITRLRRVVDIADDAAPLLFLLDEILHGTNSHDRRVGAEALARALIARGAIGLITTHDLALARLADDPAASAVNVHFQDEIVDGKMVFDYRLRPGVVAKSNAIELMRAVGLEV